MLTVAPGLVIRRETSRRLCAPQMWSPGAVVIMVEMMVELMVMMEFKLAMMEIMMLQQ